MISLRNSFTAQFALSKAQNISDDVSDNMLFVFFV